MTENVSEISDYEFLILQFLSGKLGLNMPWTVKTIEALKSLVEKNMAELILDKGNVDLYRINENGVNFLNQKGKQDVSSE